MDSINTTNKDIKNKKVNIINEYIPLLIKGFFKFFILQNKFSV